MTPRPAPKEKDTPLDTLGLVLALLKSPVWDYAQYLHAVQACRLFMRLWNFAVLEEEELQRKRVADHDRRRYPAPPPLAFLVREIRDLQTLYKNAACMLQRRIEAYCAHVLRVD